MNSRMQSASLFTAALLLAGCSSVPLSYVEGLPNTRTDVALYPVRVVSIDGHIEFNKPSDLVRIDPGTRWLVLEAEGGDSARRHVQKSFAFKVAPCTHYYLAARRDSPMAADWSLVVDRAEPVPACNPEEEMRKAKAAG